MRVVNASGVPGLARQARAALEVQGFAAVTTRNGVIGRTGALVEYSRARPRLPGTVAAAFPGARVKETSASGRACG